MVSMSLWKWLAKQSNGSWRGADQFLLPQRHFEAALRRERLRADRNSTNFSMLLLTFGRRDGAAVFKTTADILEQRIRETDLPGWLKERTIGVVLPDTPVEGANKLADDLRRLLADRHVSPRFSIHHYPSFDSNEGRQREDRDRHDTTRGLSEMSPPQPLEVLLLQKLPAWKRAIDIAGASIGIALLSPIMLIAALAIKLTSSGPILYKQRRDGLGGHKFWIYKFRTMVVNADSLKDELRAISEQDGPAFKLKNDPRVTPIGRFLRRSCIDELPQLFNVLRGEMSIVGPRPMCSNEARECSQWERRRLDVTPGLTCTWQVRGGTKVTFSEWMRMDLRYVRSQSLALDLQLIAMTVPSVVRRDGVY